MVRRAPGSCLRSLRRPKMCVAALRGGLTGEGREELLGTADLVPNTAVRPRGNRSAHVGGSGDPVWEDGVPSPRCGTGTGGFHVCSTIDRYCALCRPDRQQRGQHRRGAGVAEGSVDVGAVRLHSVPGRARVPPGGRSSPEDCSSRSRPQRFCRPGWVGPDAVVVSLLALGVWTILTVLPELGGEPSAVARVEQPGPTGRDDRRRARGVRGRRAAASRATSAPRSRCWAGGVGQRRRRHGPSATGVPAAPGAGRCPARRGGLRRPGVRPPLRPAGRGLRGRRRAEPDASTSRCWSRPSAAWTASPSWPPRSVPTPWSWCPARPSAPTRCAG